MTFCERLLQPRVIILDGAMGTEFERRGIPTPGPLWSASALLTHPDSVRQIHEEYVRAGAEIVTANTFRTNPRAVSRAALGLQAHELTHVAVRLAQEARERVADHQVWIAGSMSPAEDCFSPDLVPDRDAALREHRLLASWLADAGVDLILIETMNTVREAVAATTAAIPTGLPVCVSFVCSDDGHLLSGETLADAVASVEPLGPVAFLVNCTPTPAISTALQTLAAHTSLPIGAYGNLGPPISATEWSLEREITPERYRAYARDWIALGARIIGGCCGTTPEYVRALGRDAGRGMRDAVVA
jgi:S-methylmethionine-dependent homocysteine/selenocysteine methylase